LGGFWGVSESIIGAAIDVHRELGPGLFESVYESCLAYELGKRGLRVERQKTLPVAYKGLLLEQGYRVDLVVERAVLVELKSVEKLQRLHEVQLVSYLRLSGCKVGLLINFNVPVLRQGIRRLRPERRPNPNPPALPLLPRSRETLQNG
jgi:GxxExxY protein